MILTKKDSEHVLMDSEALDRAAVCLRSIAHPVRLRLIDLLLQNEYTVSELAEECGVQTHIMSQHLGLMRDRGLLGHERRGRKIYYSVTMPALAGILDCVQCHFGDTVKHDAT